MTHHLAQINIARLVAPIDDPRLKDFVDQLDTINALGEAAPGFVWRLKDETNNATSIHVYDDPLIIINMSVWESIEALHQFTYASDHAQVFRRRKEWFEVFDGMYLVLWWIPVGHIPTPEEGKERLAHLNTHGATPYAFTFKQRFSAEEAISETTKTKEPS